VKYDSCYIVKKYFNFFDFVLIFLFTKNLPSICFLLRYRFAFYFVIDLPLICLLLRYLLRYRFVFELSSTSLFTSLSSCLLLRYLLRYRFVFDL
jgi:hypothetical protein